MGVSEWGRRVHARRHSHDGHPRGATRSSDDGPTADVSAFLLGRYADELDAAGTPVPVWAWTNLLAHGSARELRDATRGTYDGWRDSRRWRSARALLAAEVIARTRRGATLCDLQQDLLVPLELELARRREVWRWAPEQLVYAVRSAMAAYDRARRR